ncbi:DNA cytosine methyltransferase [Zobellia nedashkovskayae]|uniref:DNA cytosine methyltransferase n=1 Tax=Zobellia nedashkovskayae TaxID=2779510 RepID=UPI00188C7212|nr:DNA cytosine methyltransferase [Zobellia nedashkovskayae]
MVKENIEDRVSQKNIIQNKLTTLSFFSGAMGLDIGLKKEGFNAMLACEYDKASRNTINLNEPKIGIIGDLRNYSCNEILEYANLNNADEVDVIVGGPPCQAFSTAGKRKGFSDSRGNVFLKFLEVIEEISPQYFVIENVRGLMSSIFQIEEHDEISNSIPKSALNKKGSSLYYVIKRMEAAGYLINFDLYNAANFGTPQSRERVVLIGTRSEIPVCRLTPTHSNNPDYGLPKWRTLKYAFSKLKNIENNEFTTYTEKRKSFYAHLKSGQNWRDLPLELQKEALGGAFLLGGGKTGFLRRLDWNKPSPTVVTSPSMPATDLCHPEEIRPISVDEYKVIQEFPLTWKFGGTTTDKYRQIGNAVPVGLGRAIGREIQSHIEGKTESEFQNYKYSRYLKTSRKDFISEFEKHISGEKISTLLG